MRALRLIAVFVENKPGETARITRCLAGAGVNIRWVTIATSGKFGVMKFLVDHFDAAWKELKQQGLTLSQFDVLAVEVPDQPGGLQAVAECLASHEINVENISGFVANQRAVLVVELPDIRRAQEVLAKQGLRVLTQAEMMAL